MIKKKGEAAMIKINDVAYKLDDLSDDAKAQLKGIQVAEAEIRRLKVQLALAQTARNAYIQAMAMVLPDNG